MISRRTFSQGMIAALAVSANPVIFWFYGTETEGIQQCPVSDGFDVVSFDLPCHGADCRSGEPGQLDGWRYRLERGEDLFGNLLKECQQKLGLRNAIIGGVSRGAFAAMQLSIKDPRFSRIVALSPVTDLLALDEFRGFEGDPIPLNVTELSRRKMFVSIEAHDSRVSTDSTIALVQATNSTFFLEDGSEHTVTSRMKDRARRWISLQIP